MKIGITLGGGLAKGAYQFGFLKAILEHVNLEDIEIVSASSVGVLNAYALCANKMDEVEKIWRTTNYDNIFHAVGDCYKRDMLKKMFKTLVNEEDELRIPFYATITYLPLWFVGRYYLVEGKCHKKWPKFFRASIGFPVLTGWPKFYKGILTIDGGAFDNIPVYPLMEKHDLDLIFAIHFDSKYLLDKKFRDDKDTIIVDLDASLGNSLRRSSFNFSNIVLNKMVDAGYEYGDKVCKRLFADGYNNKEGVRNAAHKLFEEEFSYRMENGTIDRLVTDLNTVSQLFRGKRCIKPLIKKKL